MSLKDLRYEYELKNIYLTKKCDVFKPYNLKEFLNHFKNLIICHCLSV